MLMSAIFVLWSVASGRSAPQWVSACVWAKQQRESWLPPCWKTAIIELIKAIWGWDYARVEREEADSWNRSEMQLFSISWCLTIVHCDNKILFILVRQVCAFNAVRRRAPERNVLLQNLMPSSDRWSSSY